MKFNNINVQIDPEAYIGRNVRIGDNSKIYGKAIIGDNTIVCDNVVIGEPIKEYYYNIDYRNVETVIGSNSIIRSGAIIYEGSTIGENFMTGHNVVIRENVKIGTNCMFGTMANVQNNVVVGNYSRLYNYTLLGEHSTIGNFVFMYAHCVMTNDPYPPSETLGGGTIGDYTQVAVHCVILPGVRIGVHCLVGANSVVTRRVPDYSYTKGDPAKVVMDVRKLRAIGKGRLYPWPYRFNRGMPWNELGYDSWLENQEGESDGM